MNIDNIYASEYEIQPTSVDPGLIERVNEIFHERGRVDKKYIFDLKNGIHLPQGTEASVIFMGEGAGYKNSFGYYFSKEDQTKPSELITIFENASGTGPGLAGGGQLNIGDSVNLGSFSEDKRIGFWVKGNGYVNDRGKVYYSETSFNPDGLDHMAMVYDPLSKEVVFGFEDLFYGGDRDYNDVMFSIKTSPSQALFVSAMDANVEASMTLQDLASAQGMVTLTVAKFAKITILDDVTMYQEDSDAITNVKFIGSAYLGVESNSSVIIDTAVSSLSYGNSSINVDWAIDGSGHSTVTPAGTHKTIHQIGIETFIGNLFEIPAYAEYSGSILVTLYSF